MSDVIDFKKEHIFQMEFRDESLKEKPEEELMELAETFEHNTSVTFVDENRNVVACLGAVQNDNIKDVAAVWLIASPLIAKHKKGLIRMVKHHLKNMQETLGVSQIVTEAESCNVIHNRWLKYLGFQFVNTLVVNGVERNFYRRECNGN